MRRRHFAFNSHHDARKKQDPEEEESDNGQPVKIHAVFFA